MYQISAKRATIYCSLLWFMAIFTLSALQYATAADTAALATAESQVPGRRVEVQGLKRNADGTVTLKFVMINDSERGGATGYMDHIYLVDGVHKKKYLVVNDAKGDCVCSRVSEIAPKARLNLWATFPAPPENVQRLTVIIPGYVPMDDVPISQ